MCAKRLNGGVLVCLRTDEHETHVYAASFAPDQHTRSEEEAERAHER